MLSTAPTTAALAAPSAPSVHVDAAQRERIDLDNALRLWALGVRFATRDLVALGRPLELRLTLPSATATPLDELAPLGFEVAPLYGSHVLRVINLHAPRVGARVVGLQGAPTAPGISPLDRLRVDDFLVGIDGDDLLLAPSTGLAQVRKRILAACHAAVARGGGGVALRFVRLDTLVQVDPTRRVTHGSVLRALDRLERTHAELTASFQRLLTRNRAAVSQRLSRHKMLLGFGAHKVQMLRDAVRVDERYSFAAKFQQWYAAVVAETEYQGELADDQDDKDADDNVDVAMEPPVFEIDDDDEHDYGNDGGDDGETDVMSVPPVTVDPSQPPAQPRPAEIDIQWRHVLGPHEMKWLPMADAVLTNFIEGLVNGFASDGVWAAEMVTRSRAIAERLERMYAAKLVSSRMDNVTVKKGFTKHARMIRSNISNPGNRPLRQDVLSGAISVDALCAMTSEQLAPKALQEDRQRRYEQHAKETTITAPTGPILTKTKHGFKEVNMAGTLGGVEPDAHPPIVSNTKAAEALTGATPVKFGFSLVGDALDATSPPSATPAALAASRAANTADEVTQRLSVLGVNASTTGDTKAADPVAQSSHNRQERAPLAQPLEIQQVAPKAPTLENVKVTPEDFRRFLMVMFDPAQDLEGMIGQLQSAIHTTPLSTMSNEFELAPGVTLYRDLLTAQSRHGSVTFRARVRLLNWTFLQESSNDREATMNALNQLLKELRENRRLFGGVLDRLHHECTFPQLASNARAHHHAVDLLVRQGMAVAHQRMYHRGHGGMVEEYRADAKIGDLEIATGYADSVNTARDRAARSVTAFLSELVALRNSIVRPPHQPTVPVVGSVEQMSIDRPRSDHERYDRDAFRRDDGFEFEDHRFALGERDYGQVDKKRPFDHSSNQTDTVQREPVRRKIEDSRVSDTSLREKEPEEPPCFVMDTKGEERRPSVDPAEKERKEKLQVETYQELLKELVRDRKQVKDLVKFDWNPSVAEQVVEFTRRLKVTRTISRLASSGDFVCSLQGLDGNLFITNSNASLKAAADYVTERMVHWLDGIYADWCNLADAYNRIVERKLLQRGQQADARLSAANETRKDRAVASFTRDEEKTRGALSEYTVSIRNITAIRQVCLNMKMAKRAAAEEFRDLMEWITKTQLEASRGQRAPQLRLTSQAHASVTSTASSATTPARAPPKARPKLSNMVVCSDDSDDDDDDYHHDGGYSDDDDWHPQPKAPTTGSSTAATTHKKSGAGSVRTRVEDIIRQPYPLESERGDGDDARFRAVIRSLFTPEDALCLGISDIRGALKFQGRFDKVIVPNVKASIYLEMLRGEMFNVYASVNDVIHCKRTASSKPEACDMAVDGLLKELDRTRQVWTEMVHFFHTKELANNDPMDSFNALRLANITKIETQIESPPSHHPHNRMLEAKMATDVHCVLYVGGKPMYRVNEAVESEAHTMATCRALRFFIDLIDKGLDPTPIGQQDLRFAPLLDADLRCKVFLHEFSEFRSSREREVEFIADARWAIRGRAPSSDFGLPDRLTLNQIDRVPMPTFERTFGSSSDPGIFYFRLDATYENGKFVNHVAEYGNKNKMRAYVLHLEVLGNTDMDVYLFPPAASVNSAGNLYWSHKVMPREIEDYKAVYGYFVRRRPPQRN